MTQFRYGSFAILGYGQGPPLFLEISSAQDWLRFARLVQKRHIDFVRLLYNGNMLLQFHDVRGDGVEPWVEKPGWYGISLQGLTMNPEARRGAWKWLDRYAYEMVGKGIRLYHVP